MQYGYKMDIKWIQHGYGLIYMMTQSFSARPELFFIRF